MEKFIKVQMLGSDPEFLIKNQKSNKYISSIGIIPGTKEEPHKIKELGKGYAIEIDNVLGEFNIPPASTKEEFVANMNKMKLFIDKWLKSKDENLVAVHLASARYDEDQLQSEEAKLFGCDPDFCAWTRSQNEKPKAKDTRLRSTGCHIHVSFEDKDIDKCEVLVKAMDMFLGVPSILMDKDKDRRQLYGKAGCFRVQQYGVEYRTLSGFFLGSDELIGWMFDNTMAAIDWINSDLSAARIALEENRDEIISAINNGDEEKASSLVQKFGIKLV